MKEMATNLALHYFADEDYTDIVLTSSPQTKDFEFQMSFTCNDRQTTTADELFYKGKLLPLHLPRRRRILQEHFLHSSNTIKEAFEEEEHYYSLSFINTPPDSCNINPSESCFDLTSDDDCFFEWSSAELNSFVDRNKPMKKTCCMKLKLFKHSILVQKLKSYLKSLFIRSNFNAGCDSSSKADSVMNIDKEVSEDCAYRRPFSCWITRHSTTKCLSSSSSNSSSSSSSSSSSFSFKSNGHHELNSLRSSSSSVGEIEVSVDAAIAHCKKSFHSCPEEEFKSLYY